MSAGTVTAKGQTTIPKDVRDQLCIKPGDSVHWTVVDGKAIVWAKKGTLLDIAGMLYDPNRKPMSIEEESEAVMDAVAFEVVGSAYRKA